MEQGGSLIYNIIIFGIMSFFGQNTRLIIAFTLNVVDVISYK